MADFTPVVRNKRGNNAVKYPEQQQSLVSLCFKPSAVSEALNSCAGDLNTAIVFLLGEIDSKDPPTSTTYNSDNKNDIISKVHNKIMATYKVQKCKEKNSHDIGKCIYWHTRADRRRNPFETPLYGCMECSPDQMETALCPDGDGCRSSHNKHEK